MQSRIDPDAGLSGDLAFTFIETGAFTGVAGELRYEIQTDGNTPVYGTVDTNSIADFEIVLTGALSLVNTDFIL